MSIFFVIKSSVTFGIVEQSDFYNYLEYSCFLAFCFPSYYIGRIFLEKRKEEGNKIKYNDKLIGSLINQSHNEVFFMGNIEAGSAILAKEVSNIVEADRCSFWLYNKDRTSIICKNLYVRSEDKFYQDTELFENDFRPYFDALKNDPVIVAHNAETHPATSCFLDGYLKPLGIKSMLDVPIWYRGSVIGVICIENLTLREWKREEIDFIQILSSLFSFGFSVKESNKLLDQMMETDRFIDASSIISVADSKGKITYVNKKFTEISGYSAEEVIGRDHNIVNSGEHPKEFWSNMYKEVIAEKKIWNGVCTNRNKDGKLYYVDTFIKAKFNDDGSLEGFSSIRQDVTDIIEKSKEIEKKNTYLEHAAKILRHDMHSGINTYIPRGLTSLERRMSEEQSKELKIDGPIRMIKEGLRHTQKVYNGVYEFTNLVKKDACLNREDHNLRSILEDYLSSTAYRPQVELEDLGDYSVNEALFCTAIDNLIRNGLKYNDSSKKVVKISRDNDMLYVEDNGRGLTSEEFKTLSKPYTRKEGQKESGTGLGLNICIAILEEHGFDVDCEKRKEGGSKIKIKLRLGK